MITHLVVGLPLLWILYTAISFAAKYEKARKIKVPMVCSPVGQMNVFWMVAQPMLLPCLKRLPFGLGSFTRYNRRGWGYPDRCQLHLELGDAFVHVTPADNWLYLSDADAINEVLSRRRDFVKPVHIYKMLEIFGRNVLTVEGEDWQRHRKITTPPFNERNNGLVWTESLRQAGDMLTSWIGRKDKAISSTAKDAKTLSLHVLAGAGLGKFYTFQSASDILGKSNSMDYRESLYTILQNAVLVIMFSPRLLLLPFMPSKLRHVGKAIAEFNSYMMGVLAEEKEMVSQRKPGTGNLMSSLVRASEEEVHSSTLKPSIGNKLEATNHKHGGLTADEILGNMFIFNSAGHETTANTLAYGILLLAAHPEWQDWIAEELDCVLNHENSDSWNYESVFPRLKRCLAVMFETLRLYSPVLQIPKYTGNRDRYLEINGRGHYIPRNTLVVPNAIAVQSHPRYWGEDANTWRPSRWIDPPLAPGFTLPRKLQIEREVMHVPVKGSFIPWSDGPRVCPGKKFAQVEFVAVIARLFHTHRVFPVPEAGEDSVSAMERTLGIVKDSHMTFLLQMRDPSRVRLAWAAR